MKERAHYTTLHICNFGPFKEARVELAPLTVFIGKNSLGKSMLLYLIWVLETTLPDFNELYKILDGTGGIKLAEKCLHAMKSGREVGKYIRELLLMFIKAFPKAWAKALKNRFHEAFGLKVKDLIYFGSLFSKLYIASDMGTIEVSIEKDSVSADWTGLKEDVIEEVNVQSRGNVLQLAFAGRETVKYITTPVEILSAVSETLGYVLYGMFKGIAGASEGVEVLLVDGKAGIERVLLTAYPGIALTAREILAPDFEFIDSIYRLARDYMNGDVDLEAPALQSLLEEELGFKPHIVEEFGIPRVYIETWIGQRLPLERAPSGIREIVPTLLALLSRKAPIVYIEEPEAHLHPKAIRFMPRLMAYAINRLGKQVRITTHSDVLVSQVNNLIAMSADPEGARELGYEPSELLRPEQVRAYWLRRAEDGDHVEVEELPVLEDGFDESAFEEVARALFEERGEVYRLLEARETKARREED